MGVKRFVWDEVSDNVLLETDETDTVTARYCQRPETFGELLFQDRSGTKSFFHYDGKSSTCNLTDSSEAVTDTTLYTAYGEEVTSSGSTTNPFGYKGAVGYYTNESTSDIYVRNRSYEPTIGRWLSKDPLGFIDGTNLFRAYFVPLGTDPAGTDWWNPWTWGCCKPYTNCKDRIEFGPGEETAFDFCILLCQHLGPDDVTDPCQLCDSMPESYPLDWAKKLCKKACKDAKKKFCIPDVKETMCDAMCCSGIDIGIPGDDCIVIGWGDSEGVGIPVDRCKRCCDEKFTPGSKPNFLCIERCSRADLPW